MRYSMLYKLLEGLKEKSYNICMNWLLNKTCNIRHEIREYSIEYWEGWKKRAEIFVWN